MKNSNPFLHYTTPSLHAMLRNNPNDGFLRNELKNRTHELAELRACVYSDEEIARNEEGLELHLNLGMPYEPTIIPPPPEFDASEE